MLIHDREDFQNEKKQPVIKTIILLLVLLNIIIIRFAFVNDERSYKFLGITLPLLFISALYHNQKSHIIQQRQLAGNGPAEELV